MSGIGADVTSYVLEDLQKWTDYVVWVRAHTDVGPGPESSAAGSRTQEDGMLMALWNTNPPDTHFVPLLLLPFSLASS